MRYWLMKSEPGNYSIDDLKRDKKTAWTGVRNFQARNTLQEMDVGDLAIFYHSVANPSAAVGVCKIVGKAQADLSQFDPKSDYYEKRATQQKPVWFCPEVAFVQAFPKIIPLAALKAEKKLAKMELMRKGSRLSVFPITQAEFDHIVALGSKA
jgi:predicted RNA-binding protein with PUA-like domain